MIISINENWLFVNISIVYAYFLGVDLFLKPCTKKSQVYCNHCVIGFFHILDINECDTDNGGCDHNCTDSIGSYNCSCDIGYILATDNHGCGKSKKCS